MIAKETLFLTEDRSEVVPEGDQAAQFLLARGGNEIPDALVEKYDLADDVRETYPDATLQEKNDLFRRENSLIPFSVSRLRGSGFAKLRSLLGRQFGIRLQSTGDAARHAQTRIIFQTLDATPGNPYLVNFDQIILDPFTGPAQALLSTNLTGTNNDLVFTAVATGVAGNGITVAFYDPGAPSIPLSIEIVDKTITIILATDGTGVITTIASDIAALDFEGLVTAANKAANNGTGLVTAMATALLVGDGQFDLVERDSSDIDVFDSEGVQVSGGESEVTIATKSGLTDGATAGGWSRLAKAITVDKTYSVVFVPGTAGDGIFSIEARALYHTDPMPIQENQ